MVPTNQSHQEETIMIKLIRCVFAPISALLLLAAVATAKEGQPHITIAVGGAQLPLLFADRSCAATWRI